MQSYSAIASQGSQRRGSAKRVRWLPRSSNDGFQTTTVGQQQFVRAWLILNAYLKRRPHFLIANMAEYKQANRRRQIVLLARRVDLCNRLRQRRTLGLRDFLQPAPELIFKTDVGFVSANRNRPLNDR